ncbi:hypothetical protein [Methylobacterium nodulans]|uniref:Uncharacterized protein n=1 Tax=Methylobacterium nodulans (strain LMG 21967 / CNCM I-2342 / ORS 2060) TaxID=460265 RepID=B8ITS7_METNO|nr:hypothetical protein [Methylobacterium nodulans]ACL58993.1 conserved hypothetical protein [Methylobacterium nodulans ORS 2060]
MELLESLALPLASAAIFTLGCAILQMSRQYADRITPFLMGIAMLLILAILTVASVQNQVIRSMAVDALLPPPGAAAVL